MEKLFRIFVEIEELALEVTNTESDREFNLSRIERLALEGQKIINRMNEDMLE